MTKLTGFRRMRIGSRNHSADFLLHNTQQDSFGNPTYTSDQWVTKVKGWFCELVGVSGGEFMFGAKVTDISTHLIVGDKDAVQGITEDMKVVIEDGMTGEVCEYGIVNIRDVPGLNREMRVELKRRDGGKG